jgi:hypothetical protein
MIELFFSSTDGGADHMTSIADQACPTSQPMVQPGVTASIDKSPALTSGDDG